MELEEQYKKIYTFCRFKVKNPDVAEELTQETFLKYFESSNYLQKGKKLAFLYTIARNLCVDYYRKEKTKFKYHESGEIDLDNVETTKTVGEDLDLILSVQVAVQKLSEEEQELVLLRYTNGLELGEIAKYYDISRFVLYRKMKAIEKKLKNHLTKEDLYE
ncbi:MAG: RNA polymerase sigma factor [Eubacteriales bacterium]